MTYFMFHDLVLHKTYCALRGIASTAPKLRAYIPVKLVISYGHDIKTHENLSTRQSRYTDTCHLTMGIRSEKRAVRRFRRANTYLHKPR